MILINDIMVSVALVVIVCMNSLYIGYLIGQRIKDRSVADNSSQNFFTKNSINKKESELANISKPINIDESKVVVSIDTSSLEKKYEKLGDIKQSTENISSSIDRLKHLKK